MFTETTTQKMPGNNAKRNRRNVVKRRAPKRARRATRPSLLSRLVSDPFLRTGRAASITVKALRRFNLAPAKTDAKSGRNWWFEGLKTVANIMMRVIAIALKSEAVEQHLIAHPSELHGLVAGAVPCAAVTKVAFGPEDFLTETSFVRFNEAGPGSGSFRQGKLKTATFMISPPTNVSARSGMIAAALLPVTRNQFKEDLEVINSEHFTMKELLSIPGVIYKSAQSPTVLKYVPRGTDFGASWMQFGAQSSATSIVDHGGDVCVYLCICYHNIVSDSTDTAIQYSPTHALLDLTVSATVQLREYDEEVQVRVNPPVLCPPNIITIQSFGTNSSVLASDVTSHFGVLMYDDPILEMSE